MGRPRKGITALGLIKGLSKSEYMKQYCAENKEVLAENRRVYYAQNREKILETAHTQWVAKTPEEKHAAGIKRYGLSTYDYSLLYAEQDGKCFLCGWKAEGSGRAGLVVDHDHKTGVVRGLLCKLCNTSLGWFERIGRNNIPRYLDEVD